MMAHSEARKPCWMPHLPAQTLLSDACHDPHPRPLPSFQVQVRASASTANLQRSNILLCDTLLHVLDAVLLVSLGVGFVQSKCACSKLVRSCNSSFFAEKWWGVGGHSAAH
jgi:hypothetical protein